MSLTNLVSHGKHSLDQCRRNKANWRPRAAYLVAFLLESSRA